MTNQILVIDFETRSEADLPLIGSYEYAIHPSTQILCVGWKLGHLSELNQTPAKVWSPVIPSPYGELKRALLDPDVMIVAHNAMFEQVITRFVLSRLITNPEIKTIPTSRWYCTAAMANVLALPRRLEGACLALDLPVKKDMDGRRLILKMCKPRRETQNNKNKWHCNVSDLKRIMEYCQTDIEAESLLFQKLYPLTQNAKERKLWLLDQKMNLDGFHTDQDLIESAQKIYAEEVAILMKRTHELTDGYITSVTQRDRTLNWIRERGVALPDLTAGTVLKGIEDETYPEEVKELLQIRAHVSKTSIAKYEAYRVRSVSDQRVRDFALYHGASTGRWSSVGVQIQNLARGTIKDTPQAAEIIKQRDLESLRLLYDSPIDVLSSCLRSVIIPTSGMEFFCGDYNAIEARVLFWLAGHSSGLDAYRNDVDLYRQMAGIIYNRSGETITKDSPERQLGKKAILGCGYGMGATKFRDSCLREKIDISEMLAKKTIDTYRSLHHPVPALWNRLTRMAILAVKRPGTIQKDHSTSWYVKDGFLWCLLPSGRKLAYHQPEVKFGSTPYGTKQEMLYHYSVNPMNKKWESHHTWGGVLTENITQAVARDFMADAMLRCDAAGYRVVISVHDELLVEKPIGQGNLKEFLNLMCQSEAWGKTCPIKAEGWNGNRYRK